MRKITPNLIRLLVALAMVCGLVAIVAAPAGADVTAATVTPSPASASDAAGYTVAFTVGASGALTGNVSTITIKFPSDTTLPSSIAKENASVNGTVCLVAPSVNTTDRTVTLITPVSVTGSGNVTVVIAQTAGIKNPSIAATTYKAQVYTSAESTPVDSTAYTIVPSFTISPVTGTRGSSVTVTGKGWAPNTAVIIGGGVTGSGTVLADGTFSLTGSATQSGNVTCKDGSGWGSPGSGAAQSWPIVNPTFTMKPTITLSPTSGDVGTSVTITGTDFTSGGNITSITIGGTTWSSTTINLTTRDAYSTLDDFSTTLTVPATIANGGGGGKTVTVTDTGNLTASATFTVSTPTITITPSSGQPNTMVTVSGSHFKAADTIAAGGLTFAGNAWNTATITVDAAGNWNYSVKVPSAAASGNNPVAVITYGNTTASTVFTVGTRTLTVTPASGPIGTIVTVTGTNMTAGGTIPAGYITLAGTALNSAAVSIDSSGTFIATSLQVPSTSTGPKTVAATDSGNLTAIGTFTVTQPAISISPSTGYKGESLTVSGTGWVPGSLGLVMVQFAGNTLAVATPDASGAFTAAFTVPVTATASNLVGATDINGNTAASKTFLLGDPKITLSPTSGPVGTSVTVTGLGLAPQTGLSALTIGGVNVLPSTPVVTNTVGKFTATFTVPGLAEGAQVVSATVGSTSYTTFFTITAAPVSVGVQLDSISDTLVIVWGYSNGQWSFYDPLDKGASTITSLTSGNGYWVKVSAADTLVYGGFSKALDAGWNLIGWP